MAFAYKATITVDHTQCGSADSSDFPIYVTLSDASLKLAANGGQIQHTVTQTGGAAVTIPADFVVYSDSSLTTKIPWEVESYDGTNGILCLHTKVATLSYSADTVLYAGYGDSSVTTQQNTGSYAPSAVWVDFIAVYHFGSASSLSVVDSTGHGHTLTNHSGTATAGQVGGAVALSASGAQYIENRSMGGSAAPLSLTFWFRQSTGTGYARPVFTQDAIYGYSAIASLLNYPLANKLTSQVYTSGGNSLPAATADWSLDTWTQGAIVITGTGSNIVYLNGGNSASAAWSGPIGVDILCIGRNSVSQDQYLDGAVDEVRLSSVVRSASWILAEYNNQKTGSTFLGASFGASATTYNDSISLGAESSASNLAEAALLCSISAGVSSGTSDGGAATLVDGIAAALSCGLDGSIAAILAGAISAGATWATDGAGVSEGDASAPLGASASISPSVEAVILEAIAAGVAQGIIASRDGTTLYDESIGLGITGAYQAGGELGASMLAQFAVQQGFAITPAIVQAATVGFDAALAQDAGAVLAGAAGVGLGIGASIGSTGALVFDGSASLAAFARALASALGIIPLGIVRNFGTILAAPRAISIDASARAIHTIDATREI